MGNFTVIFKPQNKKITVSRGTDLLTAAFKAGIVLNSNCGGEGLCGKCKVFVKKGKVKDEPTRLISDKEKAKGLVLACESIIESDLEITVPPESTGALEKFDKRRKEAEEFSKGVKNLKTEKAFNFSPLVRKTYLELEKPTADDNTSDLDRVYRELKDTDKVFVMTRLANVKHLGDVLRENDFKVTVAIAHKDDASELVALEGGDTTGLNCGFAFDIGTTTITGQLIDMNNGNILGTRIAYNKQAQFGSDVITRIIYGSEPEGLEKLNEAVLDNLNEIIEDLVKANKINLSDVYSAVIAGNTTMIHLLLKIDPANIRKEPYIPAVTAPPPVNSSEAGLEINPKGIAFCLPGVSTYIGGDTVSGILSSGLSEADELSLLVDIGTNGEIVLGNREWMMACAASAGPAFEGSGLAFGMKAVNGAIQKVRIDEKNNVHIETIGQDKPKGICGSGYIDLLSEMFKKGLMEKDGKIKGRGCKFIVSPKKDNAIGKDIVIEEDDIENLKRSKGAIYSAIITLLNKVDKKLSDLKKVYIAGGFGNFLDIASAVSIGLLPDIDRRLYEFIGNSSLAGARISLLSREAFSKAKEICKNITYLDLSSEPNYMDEYIAALFFPHTDSGRFPSVL